jgi:UDP-N-acetylmuramyl tripeptide synthase
MLPHDSRRLTGPNLQSWRPGAVLDVELDHGRVAEALIAAWRRQARRMLEAVGWRGEEIAVRRFASGASLFLSAPIDGLYAAVELGEWAWDAAVAEAGEMAGGGGQPATDAGVGAGGGPGAGTEARERRGAGPAAARIGALDAGAIAAGVERLRAVIAREREPALLALRDAAAAHGVAFFADDELATIGLGAGSHSWPRGELPPPRAVDWTSVHDVPVALVTGTNGKTTTVRLTAAMLAAAGRQVGVTCTDFMAVGGVILDLGDYSGPGGARTLLRDRRVEAAVLETARGGLLRRGLALDRAAAAAVTNVAADHLGGYGIDDLAGLAETKLLVTRAVERQGRAVLNADDPELAARGTRGPSPVTWFSLAPHTAGRGRKAGMTSAAGVDLAAHLAAGGDAVLLEGEQLVLARGGNGRGGAGLGGPVGLGSPVAPSGLGAYPETRGSVSSPRVRQRPMANSDGHGGPGGPRITVVPGGGGASRGPGSRSREVVAAVADVPIAFGGAARYNLANALAAIGLGAAFGLPREAMAAGLAALRNEEGADNPGRGHLVEIDGFRVLVDYAHNPHGLAALIAFAGTLPARRRLLLLGQAGDRDDEALRALARTAWELRPDRVILKELDTMLRGRLPGQVPAILEAELLRLGARREHLGRAPTELDAVRQALAWARPGDLLVLLVHTQREEAMALLERRRGSR